MSIVEQERVIPQQMTAEDRDKYIQQEKRVALDAKMYLQDPTEFARKQAEGIAENLEKYFLGEKETFTRYFATSVSHHNVIFENFWTAVCLKFNDIEIIHHPDEPRLKQFVFPEYGYGLIERMDYDAEGNEFGVNYEGYKLPDQPTEMLGKLATGLAMS